MFDAFGILNTTLLRAQKASNKSRATHYKFMLFMGPLKIAIFRATIVFS